MNLIQIKLNHDINLKFISEEEKIEAFTEIDIQLEYKDKIIQIYNNDYLKESLDCLVGSFDAVLKKNYSFPNDLDFNKGIYYYNELFIMSIDDNAKYINIEFPKYNPTDTISWLLSTNNGYQSFLYSHNNDIYLEIVKAFIPKFDKNDNIDINYFNNWLENYSIDYRFKINIKEAEDFLKHLEIEFKNIYSECFV